MPTALLVTAEHWPATSRLALALAKAGFRLAAITPARHAVARLPVMAKHYVCHRYGQTPESLGRAVVRAIRDVEATIVIPCDDTAVRALHALHARLFSADETTVAAVLRRSLGEPSQFSVTEGKAAFLRFVQPLGIVVPATEIIADASTLPRHSLGTLPQVIKIDRTSGGAGVWIVRSAEDLHQIIHRLTAQPSYLRRAKHAVRSGTLAPLRRSIGSAPAPILLQEYIPGEQANCSIVAMDGEVLAAHSARVVHTLSETGPATVSWIGRHRAVEEIAAYIVKQLGFSGFCGFDFILRQDDSYPVLIEMNPRPTQTCHLAFEPGSSLAEIFFAAITGQERHRDVETPDRLVALFPQEFWRDPKSPYLHRAYHDVPWEHPDLISAYWMPPPTDWVEELKRLNVPGLRVARHVARHAMLALKESQQVGPWSA
jgi:glutathione synthase/RimK-type ligase-like ATP-grasp enzyme